MEANLIAKNGKSITLDNGIEVTYCEFGEEHEDIIVAGQFYYHTFTPFMEALAERYHVYGVVMRMNGEMTEFNEDGSVNFGRQWGKDTYEFARKMGLGHFHYVGKCHGVNPGWYLLIHHPEMVDTFCSFAMGPHLCDRTSNIWMETLQQPGGAQKLTELSVSEPESIRAKVAEIQTLGPNATNPVAGAYADSPERYWESREECKKFLNHNTTPICYLFGTDDIVYQDHYDSNMALINETRNSRLVLINGARHLIEIDDPKLLAHEAFAFIEQAEKK